MKKTTSIVFTGDIGFDRYMDRKWEDPELLSQEVLDFFHSADHVCANVEGALIDAVDDGSRGVFFHSMNPEATTVLKKMGADIWSIGNNHTMDAGAEGIVSTKKIASKMGCKAFGAGLNEVEASEPVYLEEAGGIGMFGVSYMAECIPATATEPGIFRWDDLDYIERRIQEIKSKCRWCIVVAHGGEEFTSLPSPYTRDRYLKFLELLIQYHSSKASILRLSAFFMVQLSHPYITTGKTIALTRWTFVSEVMSLLCNMLSRFVIAFLARSKCLLISWLQSPICSDSGAQENKVCHGFHCVPIYLP